MKRHLIFTAIAAAALFAASCNKQNHFPTGDPVEFRALIDKNAESRASLVDKLDDLTNFFVAGGLKPVSPAPGYVYDLGFMQAAVWRTGNSGSYVWNYAPKKYYPADGTPVSFYAYAPIKDVNMSDQAELKIEGTDGEVSFEYTVPQDQSVSNTAVDLLVANATAGNGQVAFAFDHALSGVTFSAANDNPAESELVYVVNGIEITALANEGTFTYPFSTTDSWENAVTLVTYKPGLAPSGVSLMPGGAFVNLLSKNDIMMVLPQTPVYGTFPLVDSDADGIPDDIDDATYVVVTYSLKDGSGSYIFNGQKLYLPLPGTFKFVPGTLYNFRFQFQSSSVVTFTVDALNEWTIAADTNLF